MTPSDGVTIPAREAGSVPCDAAPVSNTPCASVAERPGRRGARRRDATSLLEPCDRIPGTGTPSRRPPVGPRTPGPPPTSARPTGLPAPRTSRRIPGSADSDAASAVGRWLLAHERGGDRRERRTHLARIVLARDLQRVPTSLDRVQR